jgi:hypothetical protein
MPYRGSIALQSVNPGVYTPPYTPQSAEFPEPPTFRSGGRERAVSSPKTAPQGLNPRLIAHTSRAPFPEPMRAEVEDARSESDMVYPGPSRRVITGIAI